jgi:hypothetical protein
MLLSLSWTTKKLQPGHDLLQMQGPIWPWGQNSRSKVTNNGTRHIIWRWSTYMTNMKSLSWTTKKLQPGHDLLWTQGPVWPWGQSSRSKVTNNGTQHIVWRWSTYIPNMKSLSWTTKTLEPEHDLLWMHGPVWLWGQSSRSPTMVRNTSSGGGLPIYQICKACLEWQKSYSPETICYGCTDGQTHHYRASATLWRGPNKLSHIIYKLMLKIYKTRPLKIKWISYMKSILDDCGLSFIWNDQIPINRLLSKSIVRQKLNDQFIQNWFSQINNTSKGEFYSLFKEEFQLESYLLKLNTCDRIQISKLRCSNFKIPNRNG